jgi:hypothetical protein
MPAILPRLAPLRSPLAVRWPSAVAGVWLGLFVMSAGAVGYVLRFALGFPLQDELELVPELGEKWAAGHGWSWPLIPHNGHLYLLGKLVYMLLMVATGYEFRAGMLVTVGLMTAAAAVWLAAVRRLRGETRWGDLVIPAAALHWGHGFTYLMAYQLVFGLFVLNVACLAWVIAADRGGRRGDLLAGLAVVGLLLHGGPGLTLAVPAAGWLLVRGLLVGGPWWWRLLATGVPIGVAGGFAVVAGRIGAAGWEHYSHPTTGSLVVTAGQALGTGLGLWATGEKWRLAAGIAGITFAGVAAVLLRAIVREPGERVRAGGLLGLLAGMGLMGFAIAWRREHALIEHYPTATAVWVCVAWATLSRYGLPLPGRTAELLGGLAAVAVVAANVSPGVRFGATKRMYHRELAAAVEGRMPVRFAADRFRGVLLPCDWFERRLDGFRRYGLGRLGGLAPTPETVAVPAIREPLVIPPAPEVGYTLGFGAVPIPDPLAGRPVVGLRIAFDVEYDPHWLRLELSWASPAGGRRKAWVYPDFTRGPHVSTFWVDDAATDVRLVPGCQTRGIVVRSAEWLVAP